MDRFSVPGPIITPWSPESIGEPLTKTNQLLSNAASAVYVAADLAVFVPFVLPERATVCKLLTWNGTVAADNVDVGIYSEDGRRILSTGPTAQAGTNNRQEFDVTDTPLGPGLFFMAVAMSGTTGALFRLATGIPILRLAGVVQQAGLTSGTLPATLTRATVANAYLPVFGVALRSVT